MPESREIDKWDLNQMFPKAGLTVCPYCLSGEIHDPLTAPRKVLRLVHFLVWPGLWWPLQGLWKYHPLVSVRRRCSACGFEYGVEKAEPLLVWIMVSLVLVLFGVLIYVNVRS